MSAAEDDSAEARVARMKAMGDEYLKAKQKREKAEAERAEQKAEQITDRELADDLIDLRGGFSVNELTRWAVGLPDEQVQLWLEGVAKARPRVATRARYGSAREALDIATEVHRLHVQQAARRQFTEELHPSHEPPASINLTDLLAEPDEDVRYLVEGLWPIDGKIVLAAQNKAGKTTLVGNLIRALVDGELFLDRFKVEQVERVVLFDNELSMGMVRRWLRDQGVKNTGAVEVWCMRGRSSSFNILDPEVRSEWAERIGSADVLLFDCLRPLLDALALSEDKDSGRVLEAMDALCAEAVIGQLGMVHHMGHSGERSRGDSRIEDWPDAKWRLVKNEDDTRFFAAYGRDVDQPESELAYSGEGSRRLSLRPGGGSRASAKLAKLEEAVLAFVRDHPGCSGNELKSGITGDDHSISKAASRLADTGILEVRPGPGNRRCHYVSDLLDFDVVDAEDSENG